MNPADDAQQQRQYLTIQIVVRLLASIHASLSRLRCFIEDHRAAASLQVSNSTESSLQKKQGPSEFCMTFTLRVQILNHKVFTQNNNYDS